MSRRIALRGMGLILILGLFPAVASAADTTWTAGDSDWSTGTNWSGGEPTSTNRAVINNAGTAHVAVGEQTNGLLLGSAAADSGTLKIEDAGDTLESFGHFASVLIGNAGSGLVIQSDGTVTFGSNASATQTFTLGHTATGTGSYQLSGGTLTTYGSVNIGSLGVGTFTQSAGTHLASLRTTVANTGRMFIANSSTYDLTGGTLEAQGVMTVGSGGAGTARLTIDGASAVASFTNGAAVTIGSTSVGLVELKQGTFSTDGNFVVGNSSTGTFTQTGGSAAGTGVSAPLQLGTGAAGVGTYNLYAGTLSLRAGALSRDLMVGNLGSGTFNLGNAAGRGTLTETLTTGADVIVRFSAAGSGTFRGWSDNGTNSISMTGSFTNNGRTIADGYNTDRTLNLTSFVAANPILNTIENAVSESNGWFAQDNGRLLLPTITAPASGSVNWGEASADTAIDLINSLRLTTSTVTAGTLSIALMATDRSDVAAAITALGYHAISLYQFTPGTFAFGSGSLTAVSRYDQTGLLFGEDEIDLKMMLYSSGVWTDVTASVDTANRRITSDPLTGFGDGLLAIVGDPIEIPEPASLVLLAAAGALLANRRGLSGR